MRDYHLTKNFRDCICPEFYHLVKKGISLQGKHRGKHMEITSLQKISMGFNFHPGKYLFPCSFPQGETPYAPV